MMGLLYFAGIDVPSWTVDVIGGFFSSKKIYFGALSARVCLISRKSRERAGTRFSVRGVDDSGCVANYVETEQFICHSDSMTASFLILRGHVDKMRDSYGDIFILNLLGLSPGEFCLSYNMEQQIIGSKVTKYVTFDYHSLTGAKSATERDRLSQTLMAQVMPFVSAIGHLVTNDRGVVEKYQHGHIRRKQTGIVRVNCIDCLDRTNSMQREISLQVLRQQLTALGVNTTDSTFAKFSEACTAMWVANGHAISRIYAGTDSLEFNKSRV
ncbi:synaptojanin-1-like [Octopus sinensis]|uniref:Phosphatidylinositol-3-phosphatase SAC1 n=1 Tax=Octopus sinensis TaxID=2607531 RepID=A0A6P7TXT8_9MOLL|nr:synaptojanin-1-like [Octopus sinensis]